MRKSLLIILAVVLTASFADAQRVLVNYETETPTFGDCFGAGSLDGGGCFSIIPNPDATGINMSDSVGQYIEPAEGEPWMGLFMDMTNLDNGMIDMATGQTQLCADVWTATANSTFTFKLESVDGAGTATVLHEGGAIAIPNTSQWETVCDDFAGTPAEGQMANRLVLFFNILTTPSTQLTHYFDNVTQPGATNTRGLINGKEVSVYPNPATHNLFFKTDGQPLTIIVSDIMGREMLRHHEFTGNNVRVSDFIAGTYVATFIDETTGETASVKFIKK